MTSPMTPREKVEDRGPVGAIMDALWPILGGNHMPAETWAEINSAILTALASGSGDHAELEYYGYRAFNAGIGCCHLVANPGPNETNPEPLVTAASAKALFAENAALRGERDDADRRAGAAERELEGKSDSISKRERWLRNAKEARGYHQNISFDRVWAETCAAADRATEAERKLAEAVGLLREWMGTWFVDADSRGESAIADDTRKFLNKEAERG